MEKRYHKKIYFPKEHTKILNDLVEHINSQNLRYSKHCIDRLYEKEFNEKKVNNVLNFIKNLAFEYSNIFEYYADGYIGKEKIRKICFRVPYTEYSDIIVVISKECTLITIYANDKSDNHITLKTELYIKK